ncbi:hypothetical protein ATK74_0828 [Propionicimonas paludicola]|uniref:Uncharacterized protein n=1 Tax=Propionicimonas paludicola TaxID=185243 RepID=A0A2A9CPE2_9ACTN|nr:hypothetical protein [Propionicimonas paludicola]PFG16294.1 hypothetical protein ATK74_0828 [Propionicimonas paludicola]
MARLCIADPPYPPAASVRFDRPGGRVVKRSRARRYYGDGTRPRQERPADFHPAAAEWDDPARHAALAQQLATEFDGWAIATTPDGISAYGELPEVRIMAWIKPNNPPTAHRIRGCWEAVLVCPPRDRRAGRAGDFVNDVLTAPSPRIGFVGAKPAAWTWWVLDALGYQPDTDDVIDLFPGSGGVQAAVSAYPTRLPLRPREVMMEGVQRA